VPPTQSFWGKIWSQLFARNGAGCWRRRVCLLHDNVKPHTATATVSTIEELLFECIPHPPYPTDLAPSDFHVFGPLKVTMSGTHYRDDDEVRCMSDCPPFRNNSFPAESTCLSSAGVSALNYKWDMLNNYNFSVCSKWSENKKFWFSIELTDILTSAWQ